MKLYAIMSNEAIKASGGNRGKMVAQAGHAYVHSILDSMENHPLQFKRYIVSGHVAKICLRADEKDLFAMFQYYKNKCGVYLVKDAGLTVFKEPMITALGIGPIDPDDREDILSNLKPWS